MEKNLEAMSVAELEAAVEDQQSEYIRRERVYRLRINELTEELKKVKSERTEWMRNDPKMSALKETHGEILKNIGALQTHTVELVQEQERDLLNAFRSRLLDVQRELEKEREREDDGAAAWIERSRKLEFDVGKEREKADKLDRVNQSLGLENSRLKQQYEWQDQDRAFLVKQLAAIRDENQKMREALAAKQLEVHGEVPTLPMTEADAVSLPGLVVAEPARPTENASYREMIKKLTKMLDLERKHAHQVKTAHEDWEKQRTPLEHSLRKAAEEIAIDVQKRMDKQKSAVTARRPRSRTVKSPLDPGVLANFTHHDRQRAIELWLSFDGVLDALYDADDFHHDPRSLTTTRASLIGGGPPT